MGVEEIRELQKICGLNELQSLIDSGQAWKLEGSYGRAAKEALESGKCFLPEVSHCDYYGNTIPSRD